MNEIQPSLFDLQPTVTPKYAKEATIQERFEAFHTQNPQVYQALRQISLQMRGRGVQHFGMKALFELLRFDFAMQTRGEDYKLCNSYTSRYARLLMEQEPELQGFFSTRELVTE
jgi:hypothetical protein